MSRISGTCTDIEGLSNKKPGPANAQIVRWSASGVSPPAEVQLLQ